MVASRSIDNVETRLAESGGIFFHVSGSGHEASAILDHFLTPSDWLHCHYRDKALMLARGISIESFFLAAFNKDASHSKGRQMNAHMSAPELQILSTVGPVGNSALQAVGVAEAVHTQSDKPIVLCSLGDGMTQQGEVLEAIGHAVRRNLPVLFLIQNNSFAISTRTEGNTFYSTPAGLADSFYGIPIANIDGRKPTSVYDHFERITDNMRAHRGPAIALFNVERLSNHTNADDQRVYRSEQEIALSSNTGDPVAALRRDLIGANIAEEELIKIEQEIEIKAKEAMDRSRRAREPKAIHSAIKPLAKELLPRSQEYHGNDDDGSDRLTMLQAIRQVLHNHLAEDERVVLFGEDIEDPKGDVFGITKGLSKEFGSRVMNSPLAEASIVGISIGQALAGKRPVAFLQFADFLPIAYNQIFSELGSLYWRTNGGWQAPVIVMITCGGYRPGLGPFHASAMESIAVHTPGIDVMMPSSAGDAAGLLNSAFRSGRPTLFFYPKNCLNNRQRTTSSDIASHKIPIGKARILRDGDDITFVAWGNTVELCRKAADTLAEFDVESSVIDLRSLMPWESKSVLKAVNRSGRLIVAHEDNHSAGMGAEVISTICEQSSKKIEARRVTRSDTYVPCNFANQLNVLPSYRRVLETAVELLGGEISWKRKNDTREGLSVIEAIGSSPSDESITVIEWRVKVGDTIAVGDVIAEMEADKASVDLRAPFSGVLEEILVPEGEFVQIGTPLLLVRIADEMPVAKSITREDPGTPIIKGISAKKANIESQISIGSSDGNDISVEIVAIESSHGKRVIDNEEISKMCAKWSPRDIVRRTGIASRYWLDDDEDAFTIAIEAVRPLLEKNNLTIEQMGLIICSTETPMQNTPSMAALIQYAFHQKPGEFLAAAYDVNAACSGYLYSLQIAYDWLINNNGGNVLVVTTETLSRFLDTSDPSTAPVFGDAATATLLIGKHSQSGRSMRLFRPVIGANGENGDLLQVVKHGSRKIRMDGPSVFREAVRYMTKSLQLACQKTEIDIGDLGLVIPHQANQRIINAVRQQLKVDQEVVYSNVKNYGNTSSSTIPICLQEIMDHRPAGEYIGLTAFGGGLTFGGAVLQVKGSPQEKR